jgi:pimeloyl-ACP methyl ester carboxylesterase
MTELGARADETPILLIHPWGASMRVWEEIAPRLAERRRVVLMDLPGHGRSGKLYGTYPIARLAAAAFDVLEEAGIDRAVVAGNSIGGATAIELALLAPARVRSLILIGAPGGGPFPELTQRAVIGATRPRSLATIAEPAFILSWRVIVPNMPAPVERMIEEALSSNERARAAIATSSSLAQVLRYAPDVESIASPALVVEGANDFVVPHDLTAALARRIPGARLERLEACGHCPELECPDRLLAVMESFLARTGSR